MLAKANKVPADWGRAGAARLLNPIYHPIDYVQKFRPFWAAPADEFIRAAIRLLFDRDTSNEEVAEVRAGVPNADDKTAVLRLLLGREEARKRGHTDAWLPHLAAACHTAAPPERVSLPQRVRRRLARTRGVGKAMQYARRVVLLPVAFHKLYESFAVIHRLARHAFERQAATEQAVRAALENQAATDALIQELAAAQAQARSLAGEQDERMTMVFNALADVADIVEFPGQGGNGAQRRGRLGRIKTEAP